MGQHGSRKLSINNIEDHMEQCEYITQASTSSSSQITRSTALSKVSGTKAWTSTSPSVRLWKRLTHGAFTIWFSQITSSFQISNFSKKFK